LNYLVEGDIDATLTGDERLVFERFILDAGASIPAENGPQILISVSGQLETTDDLGLTASLKPGERLFAPAGSINELTAVENATVLRARFVGLSDDAPRATVTITENGCEPSLLTLHAGDAVEIINETDDRQPFEISSLDIALEIDPGGSTILELDDVKTGSWLANCGQRTTSDVPLTGVTLRIAEPQQTAESAPVTTEQNGQMILLDAELSDANLQNATLYVAKITLQGKSNTGEQTFGGLTGIVATTQPLAIIRPGRLPATLPVQTGVTLPSDSTVTIENSAVRPTEVFVVGLAETGASKETPPPSQDTSDGDRPTSRDEQDTTPTPAATSPTDSSDHDSDLASFLPDEVDLAELDYILFSSEPMANFDDSLFESFEDSSLRRGWEEGLVALYVLKGTEQALIIAIDRFSSATVASSAIEQFEFGMLLGGSIKPSPSAPNADEVVAVEIDAVEDDLTSAIIVGRYGAVVVTVAVAVELYDEPFPAAREVWSLVDAANG